MHSQIRVSYKIHNIVYYLKAFLLFNNALLFSTNSLVNALDICVALSLLSQGSSDNTRLWRRWCRLIEFFHAGLWNSNRARSTAGRGSLRRSVRPDRGGGSDDFLTAVSVTNGLAAGTHRDDIIIISITIATSHRHFS